MPQSSSANAAREAASDLTHALQHPTPAAPFTHISNDQMQALRALAQIFATTVAKPPPTSPRVTNKTTRPPVPHGYLLQLRHTATSPRVPNKSAQKTLGVSISPHIPPVSHQYPLRPRPTANAISFPNSHMANSVTGPITGEVQEFRHLMQGLNRPIWMTLFANELDRLFQGIHTSMPTGTNTCFFMRKQVPTDRTVTYGRIVALIWPQKNPTHYAQLTVGGHRLSYPGATSTPTTKLTTAKRVINSTISTKNGCFMVADIKDFFLNTLLERYEYMGILLTLIPDKISQQYQLDDMATHNGWVYIALQKAM
jgi:hypothetical protein